MNLYITILSISLPLIVVLVLLSRNAKIRGIIIGIKKEIERNIRIRKEKREAERLRIEQEKLEQERKKKEQKQAAENLLKDFLQNNPYIAISDWEQLKQQILCVCPFFHITDDIVTKQNSTFKAQQKQEHNVLS